MASEEDKRMFGWLSILAFVCLSIEEAPIVLLERMSFIFSAIVVWCCMAVGEPETGDPLAFLPPKS